MYHLDSFGVVILSLHVKTTFSYSLPYSVTLSLTCWVRHFGC